MKKLIVAATLPLTLTMLLCACGNGAAPASDTGSSAGTEVTGETAGTTETTETTETAESTETAETAETTETTETTENETTDDEKLVVELPEDDGMTGVFKWIEMEDYGLTAYLILWDDGIGSLDMVGTGTVRGVLYDDKTMQTADEGTVPQNYTYADDKLIWSYTDEQGEHLSTFVRLTAQERADYEALGVGTVEGDDDEKNKGNSSPWPDDNGGVAGVYKWVEMEEMGITANLIIFNDGTGVFDMLGVVESVKYDDDTMQTSGEGALPQEYTYEDGTLTWVTSDKDRDVSTFVKLTAEELSEYEERGIGNGK